MDRNSFLHCQSFLCPLSFSSAQSIRGLSSPNDSNSNTTKCCQEVLLDCMNLSIEPCENTIFYNKSNSNTDVNKCNPLKRKLEDRSAGPAFFLPQKAMATNASERRKTQCSNGAKNSDIRTEDNGNNASNCNGSEVVKDNNIGPTLTDPTFCKVQLILYTAKLPPKGMMTPVKRTHRRDLSEIEDQDKGTDEAILIANVDGDYFQVDLSRIYDITISQSGEKRPLLHREDTNKISIPNLETEISSCLILEMPSCCFRIFPSYPSKNSNNSVVGEGTSPRRNDDVAKFDAVRDRLERLQSGDSLLPFPLSYSGLIAPLGQILEAGGIRKISGDDNFDDPFDSSRQCLHSYSQCWNDLILFDNALENHYPAQLVGSTREKEFKDIVNNLMLKIPKQASLSFIEEDQWTKALESYEKKIGAKIKEFDSMIEDFWNETSEYSSNNNNKRQRTNKDSNQCQMKIQNDCVGKFADILKDHKKNVVLKHELHLLPLRG